MAFPDKLDNVKKNDVSSVMRFLFNDSDREIPVIEAFLTDGVHVDVK